MAAEAFKFRFQFADSLLKFRQTVEGGDGFEPLAIVDGRVSGIHGTWWNIVGDAAFCGNDGTIADGEVTRSADLSGENAAIADLGGTSEAHLTAEHGVDADVRGVTDDDQIIEFGAAADAGFPDGGAVDAGVGLDFDVVFENGRAGLLHLVPGAVALLSKTEAIGADDNAVLQDDTISDLAKFADDGMGMGEEIVADAGALVDGDEAVQDGVASDVGIFLNDAIRADMRTSTDPGGFGDKRGGVKAGIIAGCLIEKFDSVRESEVRIGGTQGGETGHGSVALNVDAVLNQDGRGAGGLEQREVAAVGEKSDLARLGVFNAGNAVNGSIAGAVETAAEFVRNVAECHGHKDSSLSLNASLAQREEGSTACKLLVEKSWLRCGSSGGGFAAGDADNAEDGQFGEGGARDKNSVGGGIQIGRSDLDAVVENGEKVIGNDAFESVAVEIAKTNPESIELGTAEESFALRLEVIGKLADKIDGTNPGERNFLVLAVRSEKVDGIGLAEAGRV